MQQNIDIYFLYDYYAGMEVEREAGGVPRTLDGDQELGCRVRRETPYSFATSIQAATADAVADMANATMERPPSVLRRLGPGEMREDDQGLGSDVELEIIGPAR